MEYVVLVDERNKTIGIEEKQLAHQKGSLHRAISVCLFDEQGRWLLQKRAFSKYHSPGKWANSCCSHPKIGEEPLVAAERRVREELGVSVSLQSRGFFIYTADVGGGLTEHEYDFIFFGKLHGQTLFLNPEEVAEASFFSTNEIEDLFRNDPSRFAPWFIHVVENVKNLPIPFHE